MKKLKKMTWEHRVFEIMDVFLTKYGHESSVIFLEWAFFWQNMGMRVDIFSWKIGNKGASFRLFWPIIYCSFDKIDVFFDQIWACQHGVFHEKFEKMTWEHCIFKRMNVFLTKYRHWSSVFFREWTFCWQNLGMRASIFLWKIWKKGIRMIFLNPTI